MERVSGRLEHFGGDSKSTVKRERIDLNHEIAGEPTGRIPRFLSENHYAMYGGDSEKKQSERQTISRRTKEGLKAAQERGKLLGRPSKLDENDVRTAIEILNTDPAQTISELAAELHVCPRTLTRAIERVAF